MDIYQSCTFFGSFSLFYRFTGTIRSYSVQFSVSLTSVLFAPAKVQARYGHVLDKHRYMPYKTYILLPLSE